MALLALTAVKNHAVSNDGSHVALAFSTREGEDHSVMMPAECLDALILALNRARTAVQNKRGKNGDQIAISTPKTWMVTADLNVHGVVVLIFDPKTDAQVGYALDAEASKKMADGLIKNADAVAAHRLARKNK